MKNRNRLFSIRYQQLASYLVFISLLMSQFLFGDNPLSPIASRLQAHVKYLSSDELEGRAAGSEGNWKAAQYIANYFEQHRIKPVNDSYFQEFSVVTEVKLGSQNFASITSTTIQTAIEWTVTVDYIPLGFSQDTTLSAPLVFAGYGISLKEDGYDDYEAIDITGKIAIVLLGTPEKDNPHSQFSRYRKIRYKAHNAREHGAVGIIYVNTGQDTVDELPPLRPVYTGKSADILALQAKRTSIMALFPNPISLSRIEEEIDSTLKPHSFELRDVSMEVSVDLEYIEKETANVIGLVPGIDSTLKDQYLVVGAHFDHLGWGGTNSRYEGKEPAIHHGADDNASGTAAMLELATQIAEQPLPRSVIFMGFTGEEIGTLGSSYYCKHPLIPLEKTIFMLNMDMVGRMKEHKLNVHGTGTSSLWETLIDSLGEAYQLTLSKSADGYGPSDHSTFYAQNIPVLFLFTGLHDDYHRPSDTWEKINYPAMETVVEFAESILRWVGKHSQKPDYVRVKSSRSGGRVGFRVYLGTIPDYSDNPKGLRITGVREDSPAERAGLQAGDIIVKFGDTKIKNIYDFTYSLSNYKPGDRVQVVVLRGEKGDQKVTLNVVLESRK